MFLKSWAGECSAWECDDLGHLNMRHYMTKAYQARQMMLITLGLSEAMKAKADTTIIAKDFHIKYLGEARPGNPLFIETGIISHTETTLTLCHMMYHANRRLAATIIETVSHVSRPQLVSQNWPADFSDRTKPYLMDAPAPSLPRGFDPSLISTAPNETTLKSWNMTQTGVGVFQPREIGYHGYVNAPSFLGRTTETIAHFNDGYPEFKDKAFMASGMNGALLEARVFLHVPTQEGTGYRFYSGLSTGNEYTRHLIHHVVNAQTGAPIFSMLGIGCLFDMNKRKLLKATPEQVAVLEANSLPDLRL